MEFDALPRNRESVVALVGEPSGLHSRVRAERGTPIQKGAEPGGLTHAENDIRKQKYGS
jgi:hypothetical protein